MSRITKKLIDLSARDEGALICYLMAGDPDLHKTLDYALALEAGGADLIELGVPFSLPLADRPTIAAAGVRALRAGTTPLRVFELVAQLRKRFKEAALPLALTAYYNLIFAMGEEKFIKACKDFGVDGVIVTDLPMEEAKSFIEAAHKHSIDTIFFVTPETDDVRASQIAAVTTGFLYAIAHYGTSEAKEDLEDVATTLIKHIRPLAPPNLPIAVGFGLSNKEQIKAVIDAGADGAIVDSAIVERIANGISPEALAYFIRELKGGTRLQAGTDLLLPTQKPAGPPAKLI